MSHTTITLPELARQLSTATNCSETTALQFITELFNTVGDALADGKNVKIKNIGTFAIDNLNPGEIKYLPDTDLAEAVNHPFAFFEPVELDDDITEEELAAADSRQIKETIAQEAEQEPVPKPQQQIAADTIRPSDETSIDAPLPSDDEEVSPSRVKDKSETISERNETKENDEKTEPGHTVDEVPDYGYSPDISSPERKSGLNPWLMFALGLMAGVVVGYLLPAIKDGVSSLWMAPYEFVEPNQPLLSAQNESAVPDIDKLEAYRDSVGHSSVNYTVRQSAIPTPVNTVETRSQQVTDTIGRNRFLTTMSRKYYGRYEFWVYIYEENASHLGNPDRIAPGTVVNIPPADKYDIDPDNPQSLRKAAIKAEEIYAAYQK